ncbi:MAG: hypothetical protein IJ187_03495 [Neisseriaceae bacterium]|nr:hypothetical protein [Neisseriaceae bacterium]MBQ9724710.1 hypothetical protein [Neisseriaceae bacterium]
MSNLIKASLVVLPLFFISACENKQEKREKLEAQITHYQSVLDRCGSVYGETKDYPECKEPREEVKKKLALAKQELNAINDIK